MSEERRDDILFILGGTLTLLALIIGFTFSMAVNRYDQRKNYEAQEANSIETEYARADMLPADAAAKLHSLLRSYLDQRVLFYRTRNEQQLQEINSQAARLQTEMWSEVITAASAQPTLMMPLTVAGMNDVLNSKEYAQAASWNRIPIAAWTLLITISILCNFLLGYSARVRSASHFLVLPIVLSVSIFLIAEIDSPRRGAIRVYPQNLENLAESLHSR